MTSNSTEFAAQVGEWKVFGESSSAAKPSNGGSKGKPSRQEQQAAAKLAKAIKSEQELAEKAAELTEAVEKEEQVRQASTCAFAARSTAQHVG